MLEIHLALHVPKSESLQLFDSRPQRLRPPDSLRLTRPTHYLYLHHPRPPTQLSAAPAGLTTPPLSFAVRTGDLLFVSGIPGFDADGAIPDSFDAQFGFVVRNIKRVLDEAGATFRDLVKVNVLLTRASDVGPMNALYASAFGPAPYPARTTCVVHALPNPAMLIEIECVASLARRSF